MWSGIVYYNKTCDVHYDNCVVNKASRERLNQSVAFLVPIEGIYMYMYIYRHICKVDYQCTQSCTIFNAEDTNVRY